MRCTPRNKKRNLLLFSLAVIILSLSSCGQIEIYSKWRSEGITIDGRADDWQGSLWSIEDSDVFVGVLNDDQNLYLCLQSADTRSAGRILRQGLTVWFDPKGGKGRVLGIRYPMGRDWKDFEGPTGRRPDFGRREEPEEKDPEESEPEEGEYQAEERPEREPMINRDEIEILGPGRDEKARMRLGELKGIEASISRSPGMIVYELKVPLAKSEDAPYASGGTPGKDLGIRIESAKSDSGMPTRGTGRIPGGGRPGMGGRFPGGGRMMGGRGARNFDLPESFKLRLKAHLASPPQEK